MSLTQAAALPADLTNRFTHAGVAVIEHALSIKDLVVMDAAFPKLPDRSAGARTDDFSPKARAWLTGHETLLKLAARLTQAPMRLTRLLAFNKTDESNWFVPWHQDRAADGTERPTAVLERMIALRVHLDDCDESSGPVEVIPGTHTQGRLDAARLAPLTQTHAPLLCLAARGDILAMRPLIVHRSQRARLPASRRVLHLEYTPSLTLLS